MIIVQNHTLDTSESTKKLKLDIYLFTVLKYDS